MENEFRITYSESRTINTGKYENTNCFLSISTGNLKYFNQVDKAVTITAKENEVISEDLDIDECIKAIQTKVRSTLDKRELIIRNHSESFVDFDTMKKASPLEDNSDISVIAKKKEEKEVEESISEFDDDELNALFNGDI